LFNLARIEEYSVRSSTPPSQGFKSPWDVAAASEAFWDLNVMKTVEIGPIKRYAFLEQKLATNVAPVHYQSVIRLHVPTVITSMYSATGQPSCDWIQWFDLAKQTPGSSPSPTTCLTPIVGVGSTEFPVSLVSSTSADLDAAMARLEEAIADIASLGNIESFSPETIELAKRALQSCHDREEEDLEAWAERLANDVVHADD